MSYELTNWKKGDKVTSTRLNKIENGIQGNDEEITELKEELTDKADIVDMLKAFPIDTASGAVASFADGANVPVKSLIVNIDPVQSGSGDPSPTNVRPISGWSEVNVNACGMNVWDGTYEAGKWIQNAATGDVTKPGAGYNLTGYIPVVPGLTYYGRATGSSRSTWFDANKNALGQCMHNQNATFTVPTNARYVRFTITDEYLDDFYINYPSTDHDYHAYSGQSINIALGQTVYGGTLDVINGVLTVDRTMKTIGDCVWQAVDGYTGIFRTSLANKKAAPSIYMCTSFNPVSPNTSVSSMSDKTCKGSAYDGEYAILFYIKDTDYTTADDFKQANASQKIVYEMATPITVQLTPHEVTALFGTNNIWADSGDSEVEYRADPTLYIGRLTEPDADMVADSNITSGSYFMVGNTLYKATTNIANGSAIVPNTNCTRKSLSEALNEINA